MKTKILFALFVSLFLSVQFGKAQDKGTVKVDKLFSAAIAGNISGEPPEREITVYLPPSYFKSEKRYPTLYLLHGSGDNHLNFVDDTTKYFTIQDLAEKGISENRFGEMIIVTPNANTKWSGSFYINSSATGNWADFMAKELVSYIDKNYRTIPNAESRAIAGHSMGGFGAITLAMKNPDIFSVAYSMNGGFISFTGEINEDNPDIKKFVLANSHQEILQTKNKNTIGMLSVALAFSPNPANPPFYADKPFKLEGNKLVPNPVAYQKWLENDVVRMAEKYRENLAKLRAIKFDSGFDEEYKFIIINNRLFSRKLEELKIPHDFEEYNGDHRNRLWGVNGRIYNDLMPFVFYNMVRSK